MISNDAEHGEAIKRIGVLIGRKKPSNDDLAEIDRLADQIENYERARWPIRLPCPHCGAKPPEPHGANCSAC